VDDARGLASSSYLTSIGAPQCNFVAIDQQKEEQRRDVPHRAAVARGRCPLVHRQRQTIAALHDVPARPVSNQPLIIALCIGAFVFVLGPTLCALQVRACFRLRRAHVNDS